MSESAGAQRGAVELRGVTKRYGDESVVDAVSLSVHAGEFFSLLGPSGSGKTTTLMMIAGFAAVDGGEILIDGADIARTPPQRRGLGMVFQNYAVFPHMNVFDNIAFPLRARGVAAPQIQSQVTRALELVQLQRHATKFARELSGGQQQRVAIARAIVYSPPVVLMDEPLGALDKNLRYDMQSEIKDIQRRLGMTVVYVTHDQEEALNMSDRIAILDRGRVAQVGAPSQVYEQPANRFVAQFLGEANLLDGAVQRDGASGLCFAAAGGMKVAVREQPGFEHGAQAVLFVRPEKVLLDDAAGAPLSGEIRRRDFLGSVIRYRVACDGSLLTVDVANAAHLKRPQVGERVGLRWLADDASLLPASA
ncbi:MAG: Spermidine/putrescine import ATP-binding protein PotA [Burkholderiaceae bacterium]|nr:Spermidine/putrescine import ATP-binding protein PotA [Burkholderiaceae bacterium]